MTLPLLVLLLLASVGSGGLTLLLGTIYQFSRRFTAITWHGRKLQLVEAQLHRELRVDGRIIAWAGPGTDRVVGTIDDPVHGTVPLVWSRAGSNFALYAAGQRLAGTLDDEVARAESEVATLEPKDPRWAPARALLESLAAHTDPATREATAKIRTGLHDALRHLAALGATAEAHAALGGDAELADARRALDEEVDRWVLALRALHLQSSIKAGSADDILAKVRAESEVDTAVREKARAFVQKLGAKMRG